MFSDSNFRSARKYLMKQYVSGNYTRYFRVRTRIYMQLKSARNCKKKTTLNNIALLQMEL